jgi:hypothetical protein
LSHMPDDRDILIEDEIPNAYRGNFLRNIMEIWAYRDHKFIFVDTLEHGSCLKEITQGDNAYSSQSTLIEEYRKRLASATCFYKENKQAFLEIRTMMQIAKKDLDLFLDTDVGVFRDSLVGHCCNEKGYATCFSDGRPIMPT